MRTKVNIMLIILIAISTVLFIYSCRKDVALVNTNNNNIPKQNNSPMTNTILGKWEWLYTIRSWQNDTLTPSLVQYTRTMLIKSDTIYFYKNNVLEDTTQYQLYYEKEYPYPGQVDSFLCIKYQKDLFNIYEKGKRIVITNNQFIFDDRTVDGNLIFYQKSN